MERNIGFYSLQERNNSNTDTIRNLEKAKSKISGQLTILLCSFVSTKTLANLANSVNQLSNIIYYNI